MKEISGNIFDYLDSHWLVITTNQGWKLNGDNVMGAGLAKYVKDNFPELPSRYGLFCRQYPGEPRLAPYVFPDPKNGKLRRLIMFPTKTLNPSAPHLSWKQPSSLDLIEACLPLLAELGQSGEPIMVPMLGCRNGGLSHSVVKPLIQKYLHGDNFTLIHEVSYE